MKPKLRFNNFKDDYFECRLNDITEIIKDGTHGTHENVSDGIPLLSAKDIYDNIIHILEDCRKISTEDYNKIYNNYHLKENDILMTIVGTIGRTALYKNENVAFQRSVATIRVDNINNPNYVRNYLESSNVSNQLTNMTNSSAQGGIYLNSLAKIKLSLPSKEEQLKISHFLTLLDKKIHLQSKKIEDLKLFKKGFLQDIFNKDYQEISLKKILKERKIYSEKGLDYPHVTLSKEGIYEKSERYNRDFLVKSEDKQYKITKLNDLCYNPANLKFGVICLNEYGSAIFSPIYVTFEINETVNPKYIKYYTIRNKFINSVRKYEQGTVYERMAVSPEDLLKFNIKLPNLNIQNKIVSNLELIDKKILCEIKRLDKLSKLKKGLIQNMFV